MKRNFVFLGRAAVAVLLAAGMVIAGCKKDPAPDNAGGNGDENENVQPGGDDNKEEEGGKATMSVKAVGISMTSVTFKGTVSADILAGDYDDYGVSYTVGNTPNTSEPDLLEYVTRVSVRDGVGGDGAFQIDVTGLEANSKHTYCYYLEKGEEWTFGEVLSFTTADRYGEQIDIDIDSAKDLSATGTANCYIVTETDFNDTNNQGHIFKFQAVKGNDADAKLAGVNRAEILWESTATSSVPERCSIVAGVCANENYVAFQLPATYKEGNAVIAAKDADGTILWSWHIWLTDQPEEQVYPNDAGTMMDRNLGAVTVQGEGDCGLLYQWGRKDPFLGYSIASDKSKQAASTVKWPSAVQTNAEIGTNEWAAKNPMTFIYADCREPQQIGYDEEYDVPKWGPRLGNYDWYYNAAMYDSKLTKEQAQQYIIGTDRWKRDVKTIYDPCPAGWKVPEGGSNSVWHQAGITEKMLQVENGGARISIGGISIWYPASGYLDSGKPSGIGDVGYYWASNSVAGDGQSARVCKFNFKFSEMSLNSGSKAAFNAIGDYFPEAAMAVRCCKIQ